MKTLATGPSSRVKTWKRYSVNGYKFRAFKDGVDVPKSTISNGVCVSSTEGSDYYGTQEEVIELHYFDSDRTCKPVLFKCDWIDNSAQGVNVHKLYNLVDVNRSRKLRGHNPFVLAYQSDQICFAPYPKGKKDTQWSAVFKIKARSQIDNPITDDNVYQEDVVSNVQPLSSIVVSDTDDTDEIEEQVGNVGEEDGGEEEEEEEEEDEFHNWIVPEGESEDEGEEQVVIEADEEEVDSEWDDDEIEEDGFNEVNTDGENDSSDDE